MVSLCIVCDKRYDITWIISSSTIASSWIQIHVVPNLPTTQCTAICYYVNETMYHWLGILGYNTKCALPGELTKSFSYSSWWQHYVCSTRNICWQQFATGCCESCKSNRCKARSQTREWQLCFAPNKIYSERGMLSEVPGWDIIQQFAQSLNETVLARKQNCLP